MSMMPTTRPYQVPGQRQQAPKEPAAQLLPTPVEEMGRPLPAPRQLVWVLLRPEETLPPSEHQLLQDLRRDPNLDAAYTVTQRFRRLMHERMAAALTPWLTDCQASGLPELVHFARGLRREQSAVQAALELPYSNGQVEGQITTLKLLKRQGYGRAGVRLLRQRLMQHL